MTIELRMLLLAVLIPLLLVSIQGLVLMQKIGLGPLIGNRDNFSALDGWRGRLIRAHANQLENLALFGPAVLIAHAAHVSNPVTRTAAVVFVAVRALHAVTYIAGITWIRTAAFYLGIVAVYAVLSQLI